jgi:spore coat polysaccharide biosynthesis protein SpsF
MRKVIIVQARISSSRLPRKVLAEICGKPVIAHIIERLKASALADALCIAIPADKEEDALAEYLAGESVIVVRGSTKDVLGRYIQAAYETKADLIVRATADNPLVSFEEVDRQLGKLEADPDLDYVITKGYPLGITVESFTLKTLEKMDYLTQFNSDYREHVTLYLRQNPRPFTIMELEAPPDLRKPDYKLSIDSDHDLQLFRAIFEKLYQPGQLLDLSSVLGLLAEDSRLRDMSLNPTSLPAFAKAV